MRQEDKQVDGVELEREERQRESALVADDAEQLHEREGTPAFERDDARTGTVAGAMHDILGHEHLVVDELNLSRHELRALEALKTAAEGRDPQIAGFVYAEDRRLLLEQSLAVLQPELANLQQIGGAQFEQLLHGVGELREQLGNLEAAQEEVESEAHAEAKGEGADDKDDDDDDDDDEEEREEEEERAASSLTGPERPTPAKSPTTLGDPKEIEAAARQPWWKRG